MGVNWNYPTRIRLGEGRVDELPAICADLGIKRPLLVTDPGLAGLPMLSDLMELCNKSGVTAACFSAIKPNPTGANVEEGVSVYLAGHHDGVIACGGGSALDVGKSIGLMANQRCTLWDLEDIGDNFKRADATRVAPVIAIPTTAGTGSEVGRAALLVNTAERRKVIIFHPAMMPDVVILDPLMTIGLPAPLTAATGMDALSHLLEAYCSPVFHPMAEGIAIEGVRLVFDHLPVAVSQGTNIEARCQMLAASTMGATAFQRGLGAMHSLAHPLGALFDAHHGLLNAVLMPYVLKANAPHIEERIARLSRYVGLAASFDAFLERILSLRKEIGIPHSLADVVSSDSRIGEIPAMAIKDPSAATNPRLLSEQEYADILDQAMSGSI